MGIKGKNMAWEGEKPTDKALLEEMLSMPAPGEMSYDRLSPEQKKACERMGRLDALRALKKECDEGRLQVLPDSGGINTHIHTGASFSVFRSPAEAAWAGYKNGVRILGINDHYTIRGHAEFSAACTVLDMKPLFSIEAVALDGEAQRAGERLNDPGNPGRVYLSGKGVVRDLKPGSSEAASLASMKAALQERHRKMTEAAACILTALDPRLSLSYKDVETLTPAGNVTERHVAQAIEAAVLQAPGWRAEEALSALSQLLGESISELPDPGAGLQNLIRDRLLKAGRPAYIQEDERAYLPLDEMISLYRAYGAIPTYPVLGNPLTEGEADLAGLFHSLQTKGIYAVEVIPDRNDRSRLREIVQAASLASMPVFNGTEHNTKKMTPMLDKFALDDEFKEIFTDGAAVLLAHQELSRRTGKGYCDEKGLPSLGGNAAATLSFFRDEGRSIMARA